MAVSNKQNMETFLADGAISKGMAVKMGTDESHVAKATANTDKAIGLCQNDPTAAEDACEVALPGGGGKGLVDETVSAGAYLVAKSNGKLEKANAAGDHVCAMALQSGVAGDLINCLVVAFEAYNAE